MKYIITETDENTPIITLDVNNDKVTSTFSEVEKGTWKPCVLHGIMLLATLSIFVLIVACCSTSISVGSVNLGVRWVMEIVRSDPGMVALTYLGTVFSLVSLLMFFCTLWYKMIQGNHKALKNRYDLALQLLNTMKEVRPFLSGTERNGLGGKVYLVPMPDKTKTVHDTKDVGKKTTKEEAEAKDTESGEEVEEKTAETRGTKDEAKKSAIPSSEVGDSQPDVLSFLKDVEEMSSWSKRAVHSSCTETLSSFGPIQTQFTIPSVTTITIPPIGVLGEPGTSYLYYWCPNQKDQ